MIWSGYRTLKKESLLAINGLEMGAILVQLVELRAKR